MHATTTTKKRIIHRMKIARGHLNKVISMVEDDTYCIDVLTQSQAVQSALAGADSLMLENHLTECVGEQIKKGNSKKAIEEIIAVFNKSKK